jgi:barstar (barnase inhibitor)
MAINDKALWALRNVVPAADEPALLAALATEGVATLVLHGDGVVDTASLMARAHRDLPHPAGRGVSSDWTALADSLWECLVLSPASELALVWRDSDQLLRARLDDFLDAVDALHKLGRQLYAPSHRDTPRKTLYLFLVGRGAGYACAGHAERAASSTVG